MFSTCVLPLLWVSALILDQVEIPVLNNRPSAIFELLSPPGSDLKLIPEGVIVMPVDGRGVLVVNGPSDRIELLRDFVRRIDVMPKAVTMKVEVFSPIDHYYATYTAEIRNNRPWTMTDSIAGLTIRVQPRINNDRTIWITLNASSPSGASEWIARQKLGAPDSLLFDGLTEYDEDKDSGEPFVRVTTVNIIGPMMDD